MKRVALIAFSAVAFLAVVFAAQSVPSPTDNVTNKVNGYSNVSQPEPKQKSICDGTSVTTNCTNAGINYATYIYHPAIPEKSHDETVTTYEEEIIGYCTLCNDGTYSPSCATGRGACSHHDGVAQWNAPQYAKVAKTSTKAVIDSPAREAYYEKVVE
jgi:hypothetical protein